jgi:RES domain-containing protein
MLEMLVHVDREDVPINRRLLSYDIPDDSITELERLPQAWMKLPYSPEVRAAGDSWIEKKSSLALLVPSAIARHESNILINPGHARFAEIKLLQDEPLALDARLFP